MTLGEQLENKHLGRGESGGITRTAITHDGLRCRVSAAVRSCRVGRLSYVGNRFRDKFLYPRTVSMTAAAATSHPRRQPQEISSLFPTALHDESPRKIMPGWPGLLPTWHAGKRIRSIPDRFALLLLRARCRDVGRCAIDG